MLLSRVNGWTSGKLRAIVNDNTGATKTGLSTSSSGLLIAAIADVEAAATVYSASASTIDTIATLGTFAAPTAGHCRFKEVDSANLTGLYEIQLEDTRWAVSNAGYVIVMLQAPGSSVPAQGFLIDLGSQVDVRQIAAQAVVAASGVLGVNLTQMLGSAARAQALSDEMDGRTPGTISAGFTPTLTTFECSDISNASTTPIWINRGFLVTSGVLKGYGGVILGDIIGTTGRRFTTSTMPALFTAGDTIRIL